MRRTRILALVCAIAMTGCRRVDAPTTLRLPAGLSVLPPSLTDLGADAVTVNRDGRPGETVALARSDDGLSFSGFIAVDPGEYTLEVTFTGLYHERRIFVGRWISDLLTVVAGQASEPHFNALDTRGRPEDGADEDDDGLAIIDEIRFGTDENRQDSDGDGLVDGQDCDPTDPDSRFAILGSIFDCDGDGSSRADLDFGVRGDDCDDHQAAINPRAHDECGDQLDTDCNVATCPDDLGLGPMIELLEPNDGETLGCYRRIRARIQGIESTDAAPQVRFLDPGGSMNEVAHAPMTFESGSTWRTDTFDRGVRDADHLVFLENGTASLLLSATDKRGKSGSRSFSVIFELTTPQATLEPASLLGIDRPVMVTVAASSPHAIGRLALMRAPIDAGGSAHRSSEIEIGHAEGTTNAMFAIDPGQIASGDWAIYPIVRDAIGNELRPEDDFSVEADTTSVETALGCVFDSGQRVPLRRLSIASAPHTLKMRDKLAQALALAAAQDANAALVEIRGEGIQRDGLIRFDRVIDDAGKYWRYTFFDFSAEKRVEVTYETGGDLASPQVVLTENDPFGFSFHAITNVEGLLDSDAVTARYDESSMCPALTGNVDTDSIRYQGGTDMIDYVRIDVGNGYWRATSVAPLMEVITCGN